MLTDAQLATLRADIIAQGAPGGPLEVLYTTRQDNRIAEWYNVPASPAVKLWRPNVPVADLNDAIVWADFIGLSPNGAQKQQAYMAMTQAGYIKATDPQVRSGMSAIFGAASASLTAITAASQRDGTRLEVLFAGAPQSGARVSAVFGYEVPHEEISRALNAQG
jgi:hypothetical protein